MLRLRSICSKSNEPCWSNNAAWNLRRLYGENELAFNCCLLGKSQRTIGKVNSQNPSTQPIKHPHHQKNRYQNYQYHTHTLIHSSNPAPFATATIPPPLFFRLPCCTPLNSSPSISSAPMPFGRRYVYPKNAFLFRNSMHFLPTTGSRSVLSRGRFFSFLFTPSGAAPAPPSSRPSLTTSPSPLLRSLATTSPPRFTPSPPPRTATRRPPPQRIPSLPLRTATRRPPPPTTPPRPFTPPLCNIWGKDLVQRIPREYYYPPSRHFSVCKDEVLSIEGYKMIPGRRILSIFIYR